MGRFFQIRAGQLSLAAAMLLLAAALDTRTAVADPECTCRARGQDFALGRSVCLATPNGARIAICAMVLNNTSWQFTETPCVFSRLPGARRSDVQTRHTL